MRRNQYSLIPDASKGTRYEDGNIAPVFPMP
jgi:hypothetical protein